MRIPLKELVDRVLTVVDGASQSYLVYGGIAVSAWANPRATQDADIVVQIRETECQTLLAAFRDAGFRLEANSETTFPLDGWTRVYLGGRHADLALGDTPFDRSALSRRVFVHVLDRTLCIAAAEDLILYKLIAYRLKDLADVESILVRQRGKLDLVYLRHWADEVARATGKFEVPQKLEEMLERFYRREP